MKKNIVLAVIATAAMALSLVGCGVKVTNISVPDAATLEKGESITLPVNFGTEDAPAETPVIATGESATAETAAQDEKIAKAAEKLTLAWTSSDESVATVDETAPLQQSQPVRLKLPQRSRIPRCRMSASSPLRCPQKN